MGASPSPIIYIVRTILHGFGSVRPSGLFWANMEIAGQVSYGLDGGVATRSDETLMRSEDCEKPIERLYVYYIWMLHVLGWYRALLVAVIWYQSILVFGLSSCNTSGRDMRNRLLDQSLTFPHHGYRNQRSICTSNISTSTWDVGDQLYKHDTELTYFIMSRVSRWWVISLKLVKFSDVLFVLESAFQGAHVCAVVVRGIQRKSCRQIL